jgi:transcriptional repressor NrdR
MNCAVCTSPDHRVIETEDSGDAIRRRRQCLRCKHRWTTFERDEALAVDARDKALAHLGAAQAILARG